MRLIQLTPGTGNFYCGSCLHDNALVRALRARGHDDLMVPLYLPFVVEDPALATQTPIFLGGLSVYLAQKFPGLRRVPAWLNRLFSSPALLRQLARLAGMTSARDLGESTLSMLRGEHGRQAGELDRLVEWLRPLPARSKAKRRSSMTSPNPTASPRGTCSHSALPRLTTSSQSAATLAT